MKVQRSQKEYAHIQDHDDAFEYKNLLVSRESFKSEENLAEEI